MRSCSRVTASRTLTVESDCATTISWPSGAQVTASILEGRTVIAVLGSHKLEAPCTTLTERLESFPYSFQTIDDLDTRTSADWRMWAGDLEIMLKNPVTNREQLSTSSTHSD